MCRCLESGRVLREVVTPILGLHGIFTAKNLTRTLSLPVEGPPHATLIDVFKTGHLWDALLALRASSCVKDGDFESRTRGFCILRWGIRRVALSARSRLRHHGRVVGSNAKLRNLHRAGLSAANFDFDLWPASAINLGGKASVRGKGRTTGWARTGKGALL